MLAASADSGAPAPKRQRLDDAAAADKPKPTAASLSKTKTAKAKAPATGKNELAVTFAQTPEICADDHDPFGTAYFAHHNIDAVFNVGPLNYPFNMNVHFVVSDPDGGVLEDREILSEFSPEEYSGRPLGRPRAAWPNLDERGAEKVCWWHLGNILREQCVGMLCVNLKRFGPRSRHNFVADRMKQAQKSAESVDSLSRLERSTQWNLSRLKMDTSRLSGISSR